MTLRYVGAEEYLTLAVQTPHPQYWNVAGGMDVHTGQDFLAAQNTLYAFAKPGQVWLVCPSRDHPLYPKEV